MNTKLAHTPLAYPSMAPQSIREKTLSEASPQPWVVPELLCVSCWILALCSVIARVSSKTCTTSSAPCSICCYCLLAPLYGFLIMHRKAITHQRQQRIQQQQWLAGEFRAICSNFSSRWTRVDSLVTGSWMKPSDPTTCWQNGLSKAFHRSWLTSQYKPWQH